MMQSMCVANRLTDVMRHWFLWSLSWLGRVWSHWKPHGGHLCPGNKHHPLRIQEHWIGAPGWLTRLSVWLQLRSRSHRLWVRALHQPLCWQLRAWSLPQILCLPLPLPLPCSCSLSLSVSKIKIKTFKKFKKKDECMYKMQREILH